MTIVGIAKDLRDYFKDYKGCANCKHQPEPLRMCNWGRKRDHIELICSRWEKKE